ncbi:MAG: hypothetical protein ACE5JG_03230, partial [Planctomycetota bacterium]
EIRRFVGHSRLVRSGVFSSDGRWVLTGSGDGTARLWDAATGQEVRRFVGHGRGASSKNVESVAFSPDGRWVLTGSWDLTARLWDTATGEELRRFIGHSGKLTSVFFSPDGRALLTGSEDGTARLWDAGTGEELRRFTGHSPEVYCASFSPDGRWIVTGSEDGTARLWDTETGGEVRRFVGHSRAVYSASFSPDGRWVVTAGSYDRTARLWDAGTGEELRRFVGHSDRVWSAVFSPDGRWVLTGSADKTARLWDTATGQEARRFAGHSRVVWPVAFAPDGRWALTGSLDGTARLWDVQTGQEVRRLEGHSKKWQLVSGVSFSPDGRRVLTTSDDGTARLWEAATGRELRRLERETGGGMGASFSPDGRMVLIGGRIPTLRDAATGQVLRRFAGHSAKVYSVTFSPDGRRVLTGSHDGTVRLWDAATGEELCRLIGLQGGSWAVVTPDGRFDTNDLERVDGLHWVMPDDPFMPLPIEVFMRDYYEPRLLPRLLAGEELPRLRSLVDLHRVQPDVRVARVEARAGRPDEVRVTVEVASRRKVLAGVEVQSGAHDLRLFRDGRLVGYAPATGGPLKLDETGKASVVFDAIRLPRTGAERVTLSAYAFNVDRVKSATHRLDYDVPAGVAPRQGTAYVVSMGVDAFDDPKWNLSYAAADARALSEAVSARLSKSERYERVVRVLLTSEREKGARTVDRARKADLEALLALLAGREMDPERVERIPEAKQLSRARPEDLVVLSMSTHGHTDRKGEFHIVPSDVVRGDRWLQSCISADELSRWLRDVDAGEMVMVVDACHSAASVDAGGFKPGPMGSRGLGQLAYNKKMQILAASQASDVALESRVIRHGVLTYALVQDGLRKGRADFAPRDERITLTEWLRYGEQRVPALAEEVAQGKVRAMSDRGLDVSRGRRRVAQQPALFDFSRRRDEVVLASR